MLVMVLFFATKSPSTLGRSPRNFATLGVVGVVRVLVADAQNTSRGP